MKILKIIFPMLLAVLAFGTLTSNAYGATKIAPTEGEVGHPFTIIDTPNKRLINGSVAVFRLGGLEVVVPARTHKPYNTMQGRLPLDMYSGVYEVVVRRPDGTEFEIGLFTVYGQTAPPPSIAPDIGAPGDGFTIADPLARIRTGDLALFYAEGTDPAVSGVPADNVVVSGDGMTLNGDVPAAAAQGVQNFVSVRPTATADSRFGDLGFFVTVVVGEPFVTPTCGIIGTSFTITDPEGRMVVADRVIITEEGGAPEQGTQIVDAVFSPDGTTATGTIPQTLASGPYFLTVHAGDPIVMPPLFNGLAYFVDGNTCNPSIEPTSGTIFTPFTIYDPNGRMTTADRIIIYSEGGGPDEGWVITDAVFSPDGTTATGTIPGGPPSGTHYITVHAGDPATNPPLFNAIMFLIT